MLLQRVGRRANGRDTPLVVLRSRTLAPPASAPTIIRSTTVLHLHQTILSPAYRGSDDTRVVWLPLSRQPVRPVPPPDPSRPTQAARTLLRLFSQTAVRRELRPFYREMVYSLLRERQEHARSRPGEAIAWIAGLLGRQTALLALTRFCLTVLRARGDDLVRDRRGICLAAGGLPREKTIRQRFFHPACRYSWREKPAVQPALRAREMRGVPAPEQKPRDRPAAAPLGAASAFSGSAAPTVRLSRDEFQALVQSVAGALERQARQESLRKGMEEP